MERQPTVALALGSGGARGYAHIGVIQVLEERGARIVSIAGSSMGALVGGLQAAGRLGEYTDWVLGMSQFDVLRMLDLSISAPGVIHAEKVFSRVRELLGGVCIEDLPVAYTAVATDLFARREVWFQQGPIDTAIRASIAIPGVFTPVIHNGRMLVDGGVMHPVPIAPTASVQVDATIAVSLGGERRTAGEAAPERTTAQDAPPEEWAERFRRGASALLDRDLVRGWLQRFGAGGADTDADAASDGGTGPGPVIDPSAFADAAGDDALPANLGRFDVMTQSLEAMQSVLTRYALAAHPPDVMITVSKDVCRTVDFHRAAEMIELGRTLAVEALDAAALPGLS